LGDRRPREHGVAHAGGRSAARDDEIRRWRDRRRALPFFFDEIAHYAIAGDTALHIAAAAFQRPIAELLVEAGADCRARTRRGAEPLHYAAGADPNALDKSGVSPLHRAVRTRASQAVRALLVGGARPTDTDGRGRSVRDAASNERIRTLLEMM
jgi:hypothetical protein